MQEAPYGLDRARWGASSKEPPTTNGDQYRLAAALWLRVPFSPATGLRGFNTPPDTGAYPGVNLVASFVTSYQCGGLWHDDPDKVHGDTYVFILAKL